MTTRVWTRRSVSAPGAEARRPEHSRRRDALTFLLFLALLIGIWELAATIGDWHSALYPRPSQILNAFIKGVTADPSSRASYFPHLAATLYEIVVGYVIGSTLGLSVAILSTQFRLFQVLIGPIAIGLQAVPKVALAPLFLVWLGFGANSKIALVILATFFPIFVNASAGFLSTDVGLIRMMRSFRASNWQIFSKVQFLSAMPFIFAGLQIGVVHAITSAVAAELLGGQKGLGVRIIESEQTLDVAAIFAVLIILGIMGGALYGIVALVRKRVVTWTGERLLTADQ